MKLEDYRNLVHEHTKEFDAKSAVKAIKNWLDSYANFNRMKKAVIGISGGKDSTVVAKILVDVLGKDNVVGLLMPNGDQKDLDDALRVVDELGCIYNIINIKEAYDAQLSILKNAEVSIEASNEAKINIAPRIRMTTLYTYGQTNGCRVAGTGNLSERTLGYFTKHGDGACDFNLIAGFTSLEVMRIGEELGLPLDLVYKTPDDGLSGMSDEEKLGITYIEMHNFLRKESAGVSAEQIEKIIKMMMYSQHKREETPFVDYMYALYELPTIGKWVRVNTKYGKWIEARLMIDKNSKFAEKMYFETRGLESIRVSETICYEEITK